MKAFSYYNPTRIEFGAGKEKNIGQYIAEYGVKKVLIVYGSERIKKSGLFETVVKSLSDKGIAYEQMGGIVSNPVMSKVYEGIELAKATKVDAVLAVGGGSVLDSTKAISAGALYEGDVWDFFVGKASVSKALRIFDIITLAATGSEMNPSGVVTNERTKEKLGMGGVATFPTVSVINPELQATVTPDYLAYSASDIFAHSLDMYFSASYLPEFIAAHTENILNTVIRTTDILLDNPNDYNARGEFAWAATQALNQSTFTGIEGNRYDTHFLEHTLSAEYNIPHGAGLSIMVPAWMKYQKQFMPERFERFADKVFGLKSADAGIEALINWYKKIGTPVTLSEGNIPESDIPVLVDKLMAIARFWLGSDYYTREMVISVLEKAK